MLAKRYRLKLATWTVVREPGQPSPRRLSDPEAVAALARDLVRAHDDEKEHFWVLLLSQGDMALCPVAGEPGLPQAQTVVRDHQQSAGQVPLEERCQMMPPEQEGGAATRGRRSEQDDARVGLGRIGADVGDALVQRQQHAALAPDQIEHHVVRRPDQTFVAEPVGFMARCAKVVQQFDREVLVELEPQAGRRGRRLSSRASSAAYARAASRWMGSSVG